jgi:hypothetical protein
MNTNSGQVNRLLSRVSWQEWGVPGCWLGLLHWPTGLSVRTREEAGWAATWATRNGREGRPGWASWNSAHIAWKIRKSFIIFQTLEDKAQLAMMVAFGYSWWHGPIDGDRRPRGLES